MLRPRDSGPLWFLVRESLLPIKSSAGGRELRQGSPYQDRLSQPNGGNALIRVRERVLALAMPRAHVCCLCGVRCSRSRRSGAGLNAGLSPHNDWDSPDRRPCLDAAGVLLSAVCVTPVVLRVPLRPKHDGPSAASIPCRLQPC
eukprot:TRINITY_DN48267_c0_g1_i1.p2 TRINITY_DN48267_c0_g1~~TRINITY_DN48267_c0_g1_i1.p2  ORF type:complete len:144 (+),score=2.15 TRINITY_DN48267_c0_g1_i1:454-885(+)